MTILQQKRLHSSLPATTTTTSHSSSKHQPPKQQQQHTIASPPPSSLSSSPPLPPPPSTTPHRKKLLKFVLRAPPSPSSPPPPHRISPDPSPPHLHSNAQTQIRHPCGSRNTHHHHFQHQPDHRQDKPHGQRYPDVEHSDIRRNVDLDPVWGTEQHANPPLEPDHAKRDHSECSIEAEAAIVDEDGGRSKLEHRTVRDLQNQRGSPHPKRLRSRDVHQKARSRPITQVHFSHAPAQRPIEGAHGSLRVAHQMSIRDGHSPPSFPLASVVAIATPPSTAVSDEAQNPSGSRKLTAQSESVESRMESLQSRTAAAGAITHSSHPEASESSKDPASASISTKGDSHRPAPSMESLQGILHRLQKKDKYGVFAEPVDPNEAPSYYDIIKNPMDFSTVSKRIASGYYTTLASFEKDIFTICDNAMTYNAKGTVYFRHAKAIKQVAEKILKEMGASDSAVEMDEFQQIEKDECASDHETQGDTEFVLEDGIKDHTLEVEKADFSSGNVSPSEYPESSVQNAEQSFYDEGVDSLSETSDCEEDTSGSFSRSSRSTYVPYSASCQEPDPMLSTISGEVLQIVPVGSQQLDFPYARSLAQFSAELGPFVWKVAAEKIQPALPPGCLFGPGWVMDSEASINAEPEMQAHPSTEPNQESCLKLSDCTPTKFVTAQVPNEIQPPIRDRSFMSYGHQIKERVNAEPSIKFPQQDNLVSSAASSDSQQEIGLGSAGSNNPPCAQRNKRSSSSIEPMEKRAIIPGASSTAFQVNEECLSTSGHHLTLPRQIGIDTRRPQITGGSQMHMDSDSQNTSQFPRENTSVSTEGSLKVDQGSNTLTRGRMIHATSVMNHENLRALEQQSRLQSGISDIQTTPKVPQDYRHILATSSTTFVPTNHQSSQQLYAPTNHQDVTSILTPGNLKLLSQQPYMQFDNLEMINMSNLYGRPGSSGQESVQNVGWSQKAFASRNQAVTDNVGWSTVNLNQPVTDNVMLGEKRMRDEMIKSTDGMMNRKNPLNAYVSASLPQTLTNVETPSTSTCSPFLGNIQMNARFSTCSQMGETNKLFGGVSVAVNDKSVSHMESRNRAAISMDKENALQESRSGKTSSSMTRDTRSHKISNDVQLTEGSMLSHNLIASVQSPSVGAQRSCGREVNLLNSAQTISPINYSNVNHMHVPSFNGGRLNSDASDLYSNIQSTINSYNLNVPLQQCSDIDTRKSNLPDSAPNSIYQNDNMSSAHGRLPLPNLQVTTTSSSASTQSSLFDVNMTQPKDSMAFFYRGRFKAANDVDEKDRETEQSASTAVSDLNARESFKTQVLNINASANSQDGNHIEHAANIKYTRFHEKQGMIGGSSVNFSPVSSPSSGGQRFRENQGMPGWMPVQQMGITGTGAMKNGSQVSKSTRQSEHVQSMKCTTFNSPSPVTPSVHRDFERVCMIGNGNQKQVSNFPHFLQQHLSESFDASMQNDCIPKQIQATATTGSSVQHMRTSESCWNANSLMHMQAAGRHFFGTPQNGNQSWHFVGSHMVSPQEKGSFSAAPDLNVSLAAHNKSIFDQSAGNEVQQPDLELQL